MRVTILDRCAGLCLWVPDLACGQSGNGWEIVFAGGARIVRACALTKID